MKQFISLTIYGFTIFFNAAISFIVFSILTHHLTQEDYGIINLYSSSIFFLSPFIAIGAQYILGVDFFKMDESSFQNHFTNTVAIPITSCVLFTIIVLFEHSYVESFLHVNFLFVLLIPFVCLMTIFGDIILNLIRDKGKHRMFSIYSISKNLIEALLTILFVIVLSWKWQGRLLSSAIALVIMSLVALFFVSRWKLCSGKIQKSVIQKNFFVGLPFIPERLAIFILGYSDRFWINHYKGTADVGLYGTGAQMAIIVNLGIITLSNVFYPTIYRSLSEEKIDYNKLRKIVFVYIGIAACISLVVILVTPFFFKYFIGLRFQQGKQYAFFLTIGLFFWGIYTVFLAFLLNIKKNGLIMSISIFGMLLSLALNFFLIRKFGALGATYTSVLVYFAMAVITVYYVNKYYGLKKVFSKTY